MEMLYDFIAEKKIITIVRGTYGEDLRKLAHALFDGGIRLMEVTFDQKSPDCLTKTAEAIRMLNDEFKGQLFAGAGTVLNRTQVKAAYDAGAKFIISPNVNEDVIRYTKELGMISIPGAMTCTEILNGHDFGADFIKLFPAGTLGVKYAKDVLAPISHVPLLATGGITEENFDEFLKVGMAGSGISGRLTDKKLIAAGDWEEFTKRAKAFVTIAEKY